MVSTGNYIFPSSYDAFSGLQALQRKWSSRKAPSRDVGFAFGSSSCRVHEVDQDTQTFNSRTLNYTSLVNIPKTTTSFSMDSRLRDVINVSGVRLQYTFNTSITTATMLFNFCILAPRDSTSGAPSTTNFFRGGSGNDRAFDFSNASSGNRMFHAAINADDYMVLYRRKFEVTPQDSSVSVDDYVPIMRQIRYNGSGDPHQELRVVYWCDSAKAIGSSTPGAYATLGLRTLTYFRDEA